MFQAFSRSVRRVPGAMFDSLEPKRLLSTTMVYFNDFNGGYGEYVAPGVDVDFDGWDPQVGNKSIIGRDMELTLSDLPAHTMIRVVTDTHIFETVSEWDATFTIDGEDFSRGENSEGQYWFDESESLRWRADDDDTITISWRSEGLDPYWDYAVAGNVGVWVYLPTVSVTGGGTQSEDDDTPINFTVSRDLPTDYNTEYNDDAIPDTTVNVTRGGTATYGDDYTGNLPTSTTTLTGSTANLFSVVPVFDNVSEPDEVVQLTATSGADYALHSSSHTATTTLADNGYTSLEITTVSSVDPFDFDDNFGGLVGESTTVQFSVQWTTFDVDEDPMASPMASIQTFTVDAGESEILSITGGISGAEWVIDGSTATLEVDTMQSLASFDVTVVFQDSTPGLKQIELEGSAARTGVTLGSSKSSSGGRKISAHPNPGAVATPTRIYHLLDVGGVGGPGHSGIIIPNGNGCTYYSYSTDGKVTTQTYNNIDDALEMAKAADYTHVQYWNGITAGEATDARAAAMAFNGTAYDPGARNCWHMVVAALDAANVPVNDNRSTPNFGYDDNNAEHGGTADHSGAIP